ncbi:hypothetical protein L3Y34_005988 [Caenorhabditis briggsae]|uniref:Uncharacterized protein n=1 Tax=Caenorhabditis briggsae TaxID=6238 RepID=A0AAE9A012_CAEBR|nr:hypothetical protein L3Y34_005988 [Caenorhabditis briggsae]
MEKYMSSFQRIRSEAVFDAGKSYREKILEDVGGSKIQINNRVFADEKLPSANDIFAEFNFMMAHSGPAAPGNRTARQSGYGQPEFNPSSNLQFVEC